MPLIEVHLIEEVFNPDRPRHCEDAGRTSSTATAHVLRNE